MRTAQGKKVETAALSAPSATAQVKSSQVNSSTQLIDSTQFNSSTQLNSNMSYIILPPTSTSSIINQRPIKQSNSFGSSSATGTHFEQWQSTHCY